MFLITAADGERYAGARTVAAKVRQTLAACGIESRFDDGEPITERGEIDLAVAVGGDGTVMRALKRFSPHDIPTFGVNAGDVGFLTGAEGADIEAALKRLAAGAFHIEKRLALAAYVRGERFGPFANEVFLWHPDTQIDYSVHIDGVSFYNRLRARGILVSTATGSTAQNVSQGGPIILPVSRSTVLTPMNPGLLNVRPLVFEEIGAGGHVDLAALSLKYDVPVELRADGERLALPGGPLAIGERVRIVQHTKSLLLATFGLAQFELALRTKKGFAR